MGPEEMKHIGKLIARVLGNIEDETVLQQVRDQVQELTRSYPVPGISDRIGAAV